MITEPEMEHGPEPARPDLLSSDGGPPREYRVPGRRSWPRSRPRTGPRSWPRSWLFALGGAVVACAVGAAAVHAAGYRRAEPPDLHGYRLPAGLCTGRNLQPLTVALAARTLTVDPGTSRRGAAVDHAACTLYASAPRGGGRWTVYTVSVTVDLHRATDPRAEFEDSVHVRATEPLPAVPGGLRPAGAGAVIRPFPGLGDLAFLTTSRTLQSLSVLEGGAVLTLGVVARDVREAPAAAPPADDGSSGGPPLADTTELRAVLPATVRHLMGVLAH